MSRIGTCIHLNTLPSQWRKKKHLIIGRGTTSVVYQANRGTSVSILTRDKIKMKYMTEYEGYKIIEKINEIKHPCKSIADMTIFHIQGPKYYKLGKQNRKIIKNILDKYDTLYEAERNIDEEKEYNSILAGFEKMTHNNPQHPLFKMVQFIQRYRKKFGRKIMIDLHEGNFMQNPHNEIIAIDPVIDLHLYEEILKNKTPKK